MCAPSDALDLRGLNTAIFECLIQAVMVMRNGNLWFYHAICLLPVVQFYTQIPLYLYFSLMLPLFIISFVCLHCKLFRARSTFLFFIMYKLSIGSLSMALRNIYRNIYRNKLFLCSCYNRNMYGWMNKWMNMIQNNRKKPQ